ncbi:MAG: DUF1905 domain-containing protein [Sinimarinibacterium flocculans]|uniref:DUF1905 domain-containing protein n=1 Tax=Sinimarinibacterium flocculans TaxID=985250 RepID=UPI003C48E454
MGTRSQPTPEDRWSPLLPADDPEACREYVVESTVWRYKGTAAWHFANLSPEQSADIKSRYGTTARGWGSIRVRIRIGKTEWSTSLFPDKKSGTYLFAIKADVRKAEKLLDGDRIRVRVSVV